MTTPAISPGRILVVDDQSANVRVVSTLLARHGYEVIAAYSGTEALQCYREQRPDLILLDIQLPGIDGYEVLRRLRADAATRDIPVIAISANALGVDIERGRAAGADDYLTKPIDQHVLVAALQRVLKRAVQRV